MSTSEKRITWVDKEVAILQVLDSTDEGLTSMGIFERVPKEVRDALYYETQGVDASSREKRGSALDDYVQLGLIEYTPSDSRFLQITDLGRTMLGSFLDGIQKNSSPTTEQSQH